AVFAGQFRFSTSNATWSNAQDANQPGAPPATVTADLIALFAANQIPISTQATIQNLIIDNSYCYWAVVDPVSGKSCNVDYTGDAQAADAVRIFTGAPVFSTTTTWSA